MKKLLSRFKPNKIKLLRKKNGVALPYVIIVSASLFILATTLCAVSASDTVVFSERYNQRQAYITAKSVIEYSKAVLTDDIGTDAMDEPQSFVVTIVDDNNDGEIDGFSYSLDSNEEGLEQTVKSDEKKVGYCLVGTQTTNADNQQEYEITIKAIVDYTGANHTTKTETLTFEGLMCKYSEETGGGTTWNPPEMDDSFDGTFDFSFQIGTSQMIDGKAMFGMPRYYITNYDALKWINDDKHLKKQTDLWEMHLETSTKFFNQKINFDPATVLQGAGDTSLISYLGSLGVTTFDFPGGLQIQQAASETYMKGNVASFGYKTEINSMLDMQLTNWCHFEDGIHVRSTYGATNSAKVTITGNNHETTGEKGTFAVFEGKDTVNNFDSKYSIVLSQSGTLKVNSFDYIVVRQNSSYLGGGVFLAQSTQNQTSGNVLEMKSQKIIIQSDIQCEATSALSGVYITAEGEGAYVAIGGNITTSGAPIVISAKDDTQTETGGYGYVYCQYTANGNENGVPVYQLTDMWGNILVTIYNPTNAPNKANEKLEEIDFPVFRDAEGKLKVPEGKSNEETTTSKEFYGGYYK